jgi:flagellin
MSVINTNVTSQIAQNVLAQNNTALNKSLERLSTGLQINTAADNPSGLIAVQAFNQQNTGLNTAIANAGLAGNVVGTAEGGLSEVSNLLTQLQGLVGQAANTGGVSTSQIAADQLQADSILNTINRISGGTTFEGTNLLNGNLSYVTSGAKTSALQNLQINSAVLPDTGVLTVKVVVVTSAKTAEITSTATAVGSSGVTLNITGDLGTVQLTFGSGTTDAQIATAVNAATSETGVVASATLSGSASKALTLTSQQYGSQQFVSVTTNPSVNGFAFNGGASHSSGTDAVVTVNGAKASVAGLSVTYRSSTLDVQFNLASGLNKPAQTTSFAITGGGANFALGALVSDSGIASIGIGNVSTAALGNQSDGFLNSLQTGGANQLSSSSLNTAQKIITDAITQVSDLRSRLGAFQDFTLGSTVNALNVSLENSSSAESAIQDTNFASETSNLTRSQILSQAATTVLAQANAAPQQALTLLRGG